MMDKLLHPWDQLGEPVLEAMLIPRPMPNENVGHLGLELWTYAAMMAPAHLRSLPDPQQHFQRLHDDWMSEITKMERRLGSDATPEMLEAQEALIRRERPWPIPELVHPIWDGFSDDVEIEMQLAPAMVLEALELYRRCREQPLAQIVSAMGMEQLEVAVMLLERDGKAVLRQLARHTRPADPNGTHTRSGD